PHALIAWFSGTMKTVSTQRRKERVVFPLSYFDHESSSSFRLLRSRIFLAFSATSITSLRSRIFLVFLEYCDSNFFDPCALELKTYHVFFCTFSEVMRNPV